MRVRLLGRKKIRVLPAYRGIAEALRCTGVPIQAIRYLVGFGSVDARRGLTHLAKYLLAYVKIIYIDVPYAYQSVPDVQIGNI